MNNIRKFLQLPGCEQKIFVESVIVITICSLIFKLFSFRRISKLLGVHMLTGTTQLNKNDCEVSEIVGLAVRRAAKFLPWNPACFPQAMAAKFMLRNRNIVSTLFLGIKKNPEGDMSAHAWLRAGKFVVTGEFGEEDFRVVSSFC